MTTETPKKSPLDTAANVAIIVVCAIAAVVLIRNQFFPRTAPAPAPPPMAEKGERFAELQAVLPAGTERALIVALSPTCHFCNESMPFYKQILDRRNRQGSTVKLIAAVPTEQAKAEEAKKLADAGATPDDLVRLDFAAVKVPGTPTLLLVDKRGKVLDVWVGKLEADRQREVLAAL